MSASLGAWQAALAGRSCRSLAKVGKGARFYPPLTGQKVFSGKYPKYQGSTKGQKGRKTKKALVARVDCIEWIA
jgi:hypothetical protein